MGTKPTKINKRTITRKSKKTVVNKKKQFPAKFGPTSFAESSSCVTSMPVVPSVWLIEINFITSTREEHNQTIKKKFPHKKLANKKFSILKSSKRNSLSKQ